MPSQLTLRLSKNWQCRLPQTTAVLFHLRRVAKEGAGIFICQARISRSWPRGARYCASALLRYIFSSLYVSLPFSKKLQNRTSIRLTRSEILDLPSSNPAVKPEVRARLDDIAAQTNVRIAVVNSPQSASLAPPDAALADGSWAGLETERVCEIAINGSGVDCVDVARVRLLVMLDELSGLHSETCDIDHKLHSILAGRRRSAVQSIQEETGTNIYFSSPLQGLVGPEVGQSQPPIGTPRRNNNSNNTIWITGEFFGVQRARDMLSKLSAQKVRCISSAVSLSLLTYKSEQAVDAS